MISLDFKNRNCIVTGGAGGIGRAVVEGIVSGGGNVALVDINEEAAEKVRQEVNPDCIRVYKVDLSNSDEIRDAYAQIIQDMGHIDVLINNAGIVSTKKFMDIDQAEWDKVFAINLTGLYAGIQSVFGHMKENNYGRIVNVASVAGKVGGGLLGTTAYASSKAGVIGLTKAIAKEGAPFGISCCGVCPAYTLSAMTESMNDETKEKILSSIPLRRAGHPREVANLILFYASDLASFITGEIGDADGGLTLD